MVFRRYQLDYESSILGPSRLVYWTPVDGQGRPSPEAVARLIAMGNEPDTDGIDREGLEPPVVRGWYGGRGVAGVVYGLAESGEDVVFLAQPPVEAAPDA
jgi:hypothetical protein